MSRGSREQGNPLWEIRAQLFDTPPARFGLSPSEPFPRVWGLLMETGRAEGPVTLVVLADQTTSLYLPTGGGFIGVGARKPVWAASKAFLETAEAVFETFKQASDRSFPGEGVLKFHLLTFDGARMAEGEEQQIGNGTGPLSVLFWAGQAVISQIRLASQSEPRS